MHSLKATDIYARHFEYSRMRDVYVRLKTTGAEIEIARREGLLTINKINIIRCNMYRDNNFHSGRQVLRVSVSENYESLSISKSLFTFKASLPVFAIFQDELEARKSLRAFFSQPKS